MGFGHPHASPYSGFTVSGLMDVARELKIVALCDQIDRPPYTMYAGIRHTETQGVKQSIESFVEQLEKKLCGFNIQDFKGMKGG